MVLELRTLEKGDLQVFKEAAQEAFQAGFEAHFGKIDRLVLPDEDLDQAFEAQGAEVFVAVENGQLVGGVAVSISQETQHNELILLYVKQGTQSRGLGKQIWQAIEARYPETKVWTTLTPYFDRRNIHFYVNVCGFHIVEYFNEKHPLAETPDDFIGDGGLGMLAFEKRM